jgi:hypothetical protein
VTDVTDVTAPQPLADPGAPALSTRHTARWVGLTVLVIAAGLIAVLATRPPAAVVEVQSPLVGKLAPTIFGTTVDGSTFALPRPSGSFVVVNFFASWCTPCQTEGPDLVKFAFQHGQSGPRSLALIRRTWVPRGRPWPTRPAPSPSASGSGPRRRPS